MLKISLAILILISMQSAVAQLEGGDPNMPMHQDGAGTTGCLSGECDNNLQQVKGIKSDAEKIEEAVKPRSLKRTIPKDLQDPRS